MVGGSLVAVGCLSQAVHQRAVEGAWGNCKMQYEKDKTGRDFASPAISRGQMFVSNDCFVGGGTDEGGNQLWVITGYTT